MSKAVNPCSDKVDQFFSVILNISKQPTYFYIPNFPIYVLANELSSRDLGRALQIQ